MNLQFTFKETHAGNFIQENRSWESTEILREKMKRETSLLRAEPFCWGLLVENAVRIDGKGQAVLEKL